MNYIVIVNKDKFDIGIIYWLLTNVSGQGVSWKVTIDIFERRLVYFKYEKDATVFKLNFSL